MISIRKESERVIGEKGNKSDALTLNYLACCLLSIVASKSGRVVEWRIDRMEPHKLSINYTTTLMLHGIVLGHLCDPYPVLGLVAHLVVLVMVTCWDCSTWLLDFSHTLHSPSLSPYQSYPL